jgi:putative ABC transport system permease protein
MVEIRDPPKWPSIVATSSTPGDGKYRAWTRAELSDANDGAMLNDQIIGIMLGFSPSWAC